MKYVPRSRSVMLRLALSARRARVRAASVLALAVAALMAWTATGAQDVAAHEREVITATLTRVFNENAPPERCETMVVGATQDWRPDACEERAALKAGREQ
jgi:hypothetical protein